MLPIYWRYEGGPDQGQVIQSISLMSLLVVKMLTVLVSTISNSQVFLLNKYEYFLQNAKASHIFQ